MDFTLKGFGTFRSWIPLSIQMIKDRKFGRIQKKKIMQNVKANGLGLELTNLSSEVNTVVNSKRIQEYQFLFLLRQDEN